jgi:hypothetical protein
MENKIHVPNHQPDMNSITTTLPPERAAPIQLGSRTEVSGWISAGKIHWTMGRFGGVKVTNKDLTNTKWTMVELTNRKWDLLKPIKNHLR